MKKRFARYGSLGLLSLMGAVLIWLITAAPSQAHWADMAAAEIVVGEQETQLTLTFPTGLVAFADADQNGQLAAQEVQQHDAQLQAFLADHIRLTTASKQAGSLRIEPIDRGAVPLAGQAAPNTHSTLKLIYSWLQPVQGLTIDYRLFLPGVPTASCLSTILQAGQLKTHVFTPQNPTLSLTPGLPGFITGSLWLALIGAFGWGALHSLSPGHGKTIVAAYLVGGRATAQHALFLAATTTITHTLGVFALGFATLFAAKYIVPDQLYRWLSLISGLMIVTIGVQLLRSRLKLLSSRKPDPLHHPSDLYCDQKDGDQHRHDHSHPEEPIHLDSQDQRLIHLHQHSHPPSYSKPEINLGERVATGSVGQPQAHYVADHQISHNAHDHKHDFQGGAVPHNHHHHSHSHDGHHPHNHDHHTQRTHSHLPPGIDGSPVTWRSLLALGISGGLIPCPAALVLLLSCIALGNVSLGLALVLAFSLGLAAVLTALGLSLVYAKQWFQSLPAQIRSIKFLPALSALFIALVGFGVSARALMQVMSGT